MAESGFKENTISVFISKTKKPKELVLDRYNQAKDHLEGSGRLEKWEKMLMSYYGYIRARSRSAGRSNLHIHKIFPVIETEAARFILAYYSHTPFVGIDGRNSGSMESAQKLEQVMQASTYLLVPQDPFYISIQDCVR